MTQALLFGIHDREGRHIVPPGGFCVDTVALSESPAPTDYTALRGDINWLVRVNWGYGSTGTIPAPSHYVEFAQACADYVRNSRGAYAFVIGNEPNHQNERPSGDVIWPQMYADCFNQCYSAMKGSMATRGGIRVMPAPIAPWDATTKYPSNPNGDWVTYFADTLNAIPFCDGLVLHTYTHGAAINLITSSARMQPPFAHRHFEFRAYRDFLEAVPESKRGLPVYITETDQIDPWTDANTGWVQAAYGEIDWWNGQAGTQKIHCLCLYRWPRYDKWHIEGKQGVINDFHAAIGRGYTSPVNGTNAVSEQTTHLPFTPTEAPQTAPTLPPYPAEWDPRLTERGVKIERVLPGAPGTLAWVVTKGVWMDEQESGGRHHFYADVFADDKPVVGAILSARWPGDGYATFEAEAKPGNEPMANFPMSKSLNEFSFQVNEPKHPSDRVTGVGMGANGNSGIHTSTYIEWSLYRTPQLPPPPIIAPGPTPPPQEPVPTMPTGIIEPRVAQAILAVESGGRTHGNTGAPLIRFEAHIFATKVNDYRKTGPFFRYDAQRGWVNQEWRRFEGDSWKPIHTGAQADEYAAFEFARGINADAAYQSISVGAAQIMGFNHARIGYPSAQAMFEAFQSAPMQTIGFINFFLSDPALMEAARRKDWREIARRYNGSGAVDTYAPLLQKAYDALG